jgi:hypothetical protein
MVVKRRRCVSARGDGSRMRHLGRSRVRSTRKPVRSLVRRPAPGPTRVFQAGDRPAVPMDAHERRAPLSRLHAVGARRFHAGLGHRTRSRTPFRPLEDSLRRFPSRSRAARDFRNPDQKELGPTSDTERTADAVRRTPRPLPVGSRHRNGRIHLSRFPGQLGGIARRAHGRQRPNRRAVVCPRILRPTRSPNCRSHAWLEAILGPGEGADP